MSTGALAHPDLALNGGSPVRPATRPWPQWPVADQTDERMLLAALHSGRWALSSPYREELFERRFAREFARYTGTRHCVPTDHGSSALMIALESLGLDYGDPVLVPALTWVASATAVFRAGLVPVLADVDPDHGTLTAAQAAQETPFRAVIVVHWACVMADVPAITQVADARGATVIEDAAQAHGARWHGQAAGSLGRLGCFSMQHAKVLTGGEGGAVVTDDSASAGVLEQLRADSRRYLERPRPAELELTEAAEVMGGNFCLDEFSAALLCSQLAKLDAAHEVRNRNYAALARELAAVPGVRLLHHAPAQDRYSLYEVPIVFEHLPPEVDNATVAAALTAELGTRVYCPRTPLHRSHLLRPGSKRHLAPLAEQFAAHHRDRAYPGAEYLASNAVQLHHSAFLGEERDAADLAAAVAKVADRLQRG